MFLAEYERHWGPILDDATEFFDRVIRDNAISYANEKNSWSVGYYLNSARYRLYRVDEKMKNGDLSTRVEMMRRQGIDDGEDVQGAQSVPRRNGDMCVSRFGKECGACSPDPRQVSLWFLKAL